MVIFSKYIYFMELILKQDTLSLKRSNIYKFNIYRWGEKKMAVILWPYNISTKGLILEDSVNTSRNVTFYNSSGSFELIKDGNQVVIPSFEEFKNIVKKEDIHLLCPTIEACKKIEAILKKNKIGVVTKKENYIL